MADVTVNVETRVAELLSQFREAHNSGATAVLSMATLVAAVDNEPPQVKDAFYNRVARSESVLSKYRSIGATQAFYQTDPGLLPMDREILYEMRGIDKVKLDNGIAAGVIRPEMARGDFAKWLDPTLEKEEPPEDSYAAAHKKINKGFADGVSLSQQLQSSKIKPEQQVEFIANYRDQVEDL